MTTIARSLWVLLIVPGLALARPVFLENVSTISNPYPELWTGFPRNVAVSGDYALVGAERVDTSVEPSIYHQTAFLYRRSGTGWEFVRQLEATATPARQPRNYTNVAMSGDVAVVSTTPMTVYELGPSGWELAPSEIPTANGDAPDLEIEGGRIINGVLNCASNAQIIEKAADGVWRRTAILSGAPFPCNQGLDGGAAAIAGDLALLPQENAIGIPTNEEQGWVFQRVGQSWALLGVAHNPRELRYTSLYSHGAILGTDILLNAGLVNGIHVFRNVPGMGYEIADRIRPLDAANGGGDTAQLQVSGNYLLQRTYFFDWGQPPAVLNVFRRNADASYDHAATLVHRGNAVWYQDYYAFPANSTAISGRTVLATDGYNRVVYHWELPETLATPAPLQETFNVGTATNWSVSAGSDYRVVRGDRSRLLRQSETAIDTHAIFQPADWTNEAIEVDVTLGDFADDQSAVSLITRWQGPHNYYEFLFGPARFEFRRMASGTLRTLVAHSGAGILSLRPGETRRLRLESIGTRHVVYIDGQQYLFHYSTGPTRGRVGVATYRAAADFDNVMVTPTPRTSMRESRFYAGEAVPWETSGTGMWRGEDDESGYRIAQISTTGEARVTTGVPTTEQSVIANGRVMRFAPPEGTQRRWFGLVARYVDENNHYILALRNSNSLVLTRRVNGVDTTLGNFTVDVVPEEYYEMRLDAIGDQLRAYLNGRLLFERTDDAHPVGNSGLTTFKTHAEFDNFHAYQP